MTTNYRHARRPKGSLPANDNGIVKPQLRSFRDAAILAGVSIRTMQRMVRRGEAPTPVRISEGRVAFVAQELDDWIAALPRTRRVA